MADRDPIRWDALVPLLIHPTKVWVIEALLWIDRPLSASELEEVLYKRAGVSAIAYHLKSLRTLGVLELVKEERVRGAWKRLYDFAPAVKKTPRRNRRRS